MRGKEGEGAHRCHPGSNPGGYLRVSEASTLSGLCLSFLICKVGIMIALPLSSAGRIRCY